MSRHTLHALMLLDAIQLFSSCSTGWADRMAVLCVSVCLSVCTCLGSLLLAGSLLAPSPPCLVGFGYGLPCIGCLDPPPRWRVHPCPRDRDRMLSAFMVMFGFLIALPNRRRKKRAKPRAGHAPLIPCLRPRTCLPLPAPGACLGLCHEQGAVPRQAPHCKAGEL